MNDVFDKILQIPLPFNMIIIIALLGSLAGIVVSIIDQVRRYACLRQELDFKRDMIDRGMTPEEIERVLAASSSTTAHNEVARSCQ